MCVAVHFSVLLEHTPIGSSAHEVKITLAVGEVAAHGGSRLPATITTLKKREEIRIAFKSHSCNSYNASHLTK